MSGDPRLTTNDKEGLAAPQLPAMRCTTLGTADTLPRATVSSSGRVGTSSTEWRIPPSFLSTVTEARAGRPRTKPCRGGKAWLRKSPGAVKGFKLTVRTQSQTSKRLSQRASLQHRPSRSPTPLPIISDPSSAFVWCRHHRT